MHPSVRHLLVMIVAVTLLTGCGGGGGGGSAPSAVAPTSSGGGSSDSQPRAYVSGTVATGAALAGADVTLTDSQGATSTATTDNRGQYRCPVDGMEPPYLLHARGGGRDLYAMTHAGTVMNANPVTDSMARVAAEAAGTTPEGLFQPAGTHDMPTAQGMGMMSAPVMAAMADAMQAAGLDPGSFDPTTTPFAADHTGFDALLDHMQVTSDTITLVHDGTTVTCRFQVDHSNPAAPTLTVTTTTTDAGGAETTSTTSMTLPMHRMHGGTMMGPGMP